MKNNKISLSTKIIILLIFTVIILCAFYVVKNIENNNSNTNIQTFSIEDKKWIEENKNTILNIDVLNNLPVFGINGTGVYHTFILDFETATGLEFNKIATYESSSETSLYSFSIKNKINEDDLVFYTDIYTVFSKDNQKSDSIDFIYNKTVGVLNKDIDNLKYYFENVNYMGFNSINELIEYYNKTEFSEEETRLDYILIPYMQNLNTILDSDYNIAYKINDIPIYYTLSMSIENKELNEIITKYFKYWNESSKTKVYNEFLLTELKKSSNVSDADFKVIDSKSYVYGYVENLPFDNGLDDNMTGINSYYINSFAKLLGITIENKEYKNLEDLNKNIEKGNVDIYFSYYKNTYENYNNLMPHVKSEFVVLKTSDNSKSINSITGLNNEKIVMLEDSKLHNYFNENLDSVIKSVKSIDNLEANSNQFIVIDKFIYNYYKNTTLKDYYAIYENSINDNYSFVIKNDFDKLYILFNKYLETLNFGTINSRGFNSLFDKSITENSYNNILLIIIILTLIIIAYFIYLVNKKVKSKLLLKNYDKIKYMDALTSLKNRNYLNNNKAKWDLNTVFPQTIIMIDLNNIKIINDTYGHEKGDAVIGYAANILINNQLENSDMIRTDGNEFLIYLVGYNEKQVITYIRKLYKLFSALPYNYGASLGYSMRIDDLKNIEDTINEASIGMRNNKKLTKRN